MNKTLIGTVAVIVVLVAGFFYFNNYIYEEKQAIAVAHYKNAEYMIEGERIKLVDGVSETPSAPGSASQVTTRYFGNEVIHDLDGDGTDDVAFLLTQERGGSGTFFYVVAALNTPRGYIGSEGILLGDRIAPQTTEKSQNPAQTRVIVVNYADRKPGEPMTAKPSLGKSIYLMLNPKTMQWGIVEPNFSGEADPARMTPGMKKWMWIRTDYNDGTTVTPKKEGTFTLQFADQGRFSVSTDCNGVGGEYIVSGDKITFSKMMSTLMYCEGSQESMFTKYLTDTDSFLFTSRGELVLNLKFDSGSVIFR